VSFNDALNKATNDEELNKAINDEANKSVIAHLYVEGKPLVLNYQLMENRLARPRLTPAQRAEYNRQLGSEGGFLTVADNEGDTPLLIHFRSKNDRYTLRVATPGKFYGYFLSMESIVDANGEETSTKNLQVLEKGQPTRFFLETVAPDLFRLRNVARQTSKAFSDLLSNTELQLLQSAEDQIGDPTYLYQQAGRRQNDPQQYFSETNLRSNNVIWSPYGVHIGWVVKGTGIVKLSDIG